MINLFENFKNFLLNLYFFYFRIVNKKERTRFIYDILRIIILNFILFYLFFFFFQ